MLTDIAETAIHVPHRLHFLNEFPIDKLTFSIHGDYVGYASPQAAVTVTTGCKQSLSGPKVNKVNNPNIWVDVSVFITTVRLLKIIDMWVMGDGEGVAPDRNVQIMCNLII